ncbi:MAG: nucleotidyltransferase domain-containing protein [Clostridia bacterium]|nr:nucleotidyltransferase domain-containing protein [Clostridia bacterium]
MSELEKITEKIKPVAIRYNLAYVWVFGSYAKKTQKKDSDVDIIVRTEDVLEGFKIVEVKFALEEALKKQVDIITTGSIKDSLLESEDLEEVLVYSVEDK